MSLDLFHRAAPPGSPAKPPQVAPGPSTMPPGPVQVDPAGPCAGPRRSPPGMAYAVIPNVVLGSLKRGLRTDLDLVGAIRLAEDEAAVDPRAQSWAVYLVMEEAGTWSLQKTIPARLV